MEMGLAGSIGDEMTTPRTKHFCFFFFSSFLSRDKKKIEERHSFMALVECGTPEETKFVLERLLNLLSDAQRSSVVGYVARQVLAPEEGDEALTRAKEEWAAAQHVPEARPRRTKKSSECTPSPPRPLAATTRKKRSRSPAPPAAPRPRQAQKRGKRGKRQPKKEQLVDVSSLSEEDAGEKEAVEQPQHRALLEKALEDARRGLQWHLITGPYLEHKLKEEATERPDMIRERLNRLYAELLGRGFSEQQLRDLVGSNAEPWLSLARLERLEHLLGESVPVMRQMVGRASGKKHALALELVALCVGASCRIVPDEETRALLKSDARTTLSRLQYATAESSELARLNSFARDAHVAYIWDHLGQSNEEVVGVLNDWFGTTHAEITWRKRRQRGCFLLQFPALAYQTVVALDGGALRA